ncbi:MAG: winged helix-turn-helix domain-containing protein [Anaerolineae bacterium]|nr:winged helix-turn-helix domain-containing protein [Anaerolineae bacterium]
MLRRADLFTLFTAIRDGECVSVVGLSNMGKSRFLQSVALPLVRDRFLQDATRAWLFVYIDCNLMAERSEQGLREIILRGAIEALQHNRASSELIAQLDAYYQQVIEPQSPIRSPLAFNRAMSLLCEQSGCTVVLLFDEFDDPFESLEGRAFLNLRATKDRYREALVYVTATDRRLADIRNDRERGEFVELVGPRVQWLGFLNREDARALGQQLAQARGEALGDESLDFVVAQAGGHPGLMSSVIGTLMRTGIGTPLNARMEALRQTEQLIEHDPNVRAECDKLWGQLSVAEQAALVAHVTGDPEDALTLEQLRIKRILPRPNEGEDRRVVLGEVWRSYLNRQAILRMGTRRTVRVDVDSGEVYVNERKIEPLTDLEYKLLLLLYGRLNKIVDKYTIVTNVWGEGYLEDVDDVRIEKLVSRLRAKLEPNATEPKYLTTVRGRGYRLVG